MEKLNINKGSLVYFQNKPYEILKQLDFHTILGLNSLSKEKQSLEIKYLKNKPDEDNTKEYLYLNDIPDKDWDTAKKRLEIITPLLNIKTSQSKIQEISNTLNIHFTTIYRWIAQYKENPILSSLLPKHSVKGAKGQVRTNIEVEFIIEKAINELYLSTQKLTARKVYFEIKRRCSNARVKPPSENTVRSRIADISEKTKLKHRESANLADRKYRNTDGVFPEGKYPLDFIQIDHTPMDIIVVDEIYRQPIGRPYLTIAIDVYSRMVTGFYISLDEPSFFSVGQCISQSILSKEKYLRSIEIEGEWNILGIPRAFGLDNAAEFRSKDIQRVCEQYGITISWRPVARPQFGGHIERLIGTSMKEVHTLPGTTKSNIQQRGEYNSDKKSIFSLKELEKWFTEYIINGYHKSIHSGIRMTPERKYELGIFGDDDNPGLGLPERITDEDNFKISLLPSFERTVQQPGVKIDNIMYYADCLRRWIKAKNKDGSIRAFTFKRDARDISVIWFYDPEIKQYFEIPYRNITYPPISIWDLRHIRQYLDEKNIQDYDEQVIFQTYYKMQKIQEEAAYKTKSARRKVAARTIRKEKSEFDNIKKSTNISSLITDKDSTQTSHSDELFNDIQPFDDIEI